MSDKSALVLWSNTTCPYAQRVKIALFEMNISWQDQLVEKIDEATEFKSLFLSGHPDRKPVVPLLQHFKAEYDQTRGFLLPESDLIINYLIEEYSNEQPSCLLPTSAADRATMRLFIPLFIQELLPCVRAIFTSSTTGALDVAIDVLDKGCAVLNAFLTHHDKRFSDGTKLGDFVVGNVFSVAECIAAPHLQRLQLLPSPTVRPQLITALSKKISSGASSDLASLDPILQFMQAKHPRLHSWVAAVLSRESVVQSFPIGRITRVLASVCVPWVDEVGTA